MPVLRKNVQRKGSESATKRYAVGKTGQRLRMSNMSTHCAKFTVCHMTTLIFYPTIRLKRNEERKMDLKERIERVLSEILSDKYEAKVTVRFEKGAEIEERKEAYIPTKESA